MTSSLPVNFSNSRGLNRRSSGTPSGSGFALVVTLSLMVLLMVLALGMLSLSSISLRSSNQGQAMAEARANARLALMLAIGDLQKYAGSDQRVTAAADVLSGTSALAPSDGHAHWVGVWDTNGYDPRDPDSKTDPDSETFLRWLVSGSSPTSAQSDANAPASADDLTIFEGDNDASSVVVPKVEVNTGSSIPGAYAYWVEDEGLKADLSWNESENPDADQKQASRLTSSPGPDYGVFGGPFTSAAAAYPLSEDSASWLNDIDKAISAVDAPLAAGSTSSQRDWLRTNRHHITLGSLGVLADMKLGGLKRDLSLAFEMDDDADVSSTEFPPLFSQQEGEFVGGNDRLASPHLATGMRGAYERFLYRDTSSSGAFFSGDIANSYVTPYWASVRGPNWWAVRDFANLYKRLRTSSGGYEIEARPYYPNTSASSYTLGEIARAERRLSVRFEIDLSGDTPGTGFELCL